jgi:hypothetical protein
MIIVRNKEDFIKACKKAKVNENMIFDEVEKMGDRISISFKNGDEESVALFSHWGGKVFLNEALRYVKQLKMYIEKQDKNGVYPLSRLEPRTVMVDFIKSLTENMKGRVDSDLYIGKNGDDGDNSDNGHFIIDLVTGGTSLKHSARYDEIQKLSKNIMKKMKKNEAKNTNKASA